MLYPVELRAHEAECYFTTAPMPRWLYQLSRLPLPRNSFYVCIAYMFITGTTILDGFQIDTLILLNEFADYNKPKHYEPPGIMMRDAEGLLCLIYPDRVRCEVECVRFKEYVAKGAHNKKPAEAG
jgi:hypothetical protein